MRFILAALLVASAVTAAAAEWTPLDLTYETRTANGVVTCGIAPSRRDAFTTSTRGIRVINPHTNATGLTLQLRGTAQLDAYPEAKAAFIRAATSWERYISNPITVIIDVDFGPTKFGVPYPSTDILGATNPVLLVGSYSSARSALIASAWWSEEQRLYAGLPPTSISTDIGSTTTAVATSANLRALKLLSSTPSVTDKAPSIGFNSAHTFDFDRADGIARGAVDFEATATHEIGHALGFSSLVGFVELDSTFPVAVSILDMFRVRPGTTVDSLASTQRIQSSGGQQQLIQPSWTVNLSTGRPDGTGGDLNQASHWKDDALDDFYWGVMDPTLPSAIIEFITIDDLAAFDRLGYDISYPAAPAAPSSLRATATGATSIRLEWIDNSTDESEFRLETVSQNRWQEVGGIRANATAATVTGLTPGATYRYRLLSTNAGGYSDYSNEASATTPTEACTAPAITSGPASQTITKGTTATLTVTASGTAPLQYQWYTGSVATGSPVLNATAASYVTPALQNTTSYAVKVSNACGSTSSGVATVTIPIPAPAAPSGLKYDSRTASTVLLSWSHDGRDVSGFSSYVSTDGVTYSKWNDHPASTKSILVTNLVVTQGYYFRVAAFNGGGQSSYAAVFVPPAASSRRRAVRR